MAHDVFISVSSKDKPTGDAVCAVLEAHRIRCWMAPRDIAPGAEWAEAIIDAINSAHCMVLVFSGHANTSPQIRREVERAVNKGIPIIPLRIEDVQPSRALEYFISTPHWLDAFTPPLERHLNRLAQAIQIIFDRAVNQPPPSPDPSPPIPDPPPMAPAQPAGFGTTGKDTSSNAQAATTAEVVADDGRGEPGWAIFCLAGGGLFTYTGVMLLIGDLQNPRPVPLAGYLIAVGLLIGGLLCAAYGGKKLRDAWLKQRRRMG